MNRQAGAIPPLIRERYPHRLIVFDTEAYRSPTVKGVELQTLRLGVALYIELDLDLCELTRELYTFTTPEGLREFITWHTRKDKSLYIYAHNLRYDLQLSGLYTGLVSEGWECKLFVVESPPTFIKLHRGRSSITLVDTFNYWQFSLKLMGEQLGLDKLDMPPDNASLEQWSSYCQRDVEVLTGYLLRFMHFLKDNDLAGLGLTLASQAFRSYRHRFMSTEIVLHNRLEVLSLERDGYYGGRCEAFYIGQAPTQPYYKLDVNSMYPYIMRGDSYPTELVGYSEAVPLKLLELNLSRYYCLADVDLSAANPAYAYTNGSKLLFPVGDFRGILHHVDLQRALSSGEIKRVNRLAIYQQGDVFSSYVDYFYQLKLTAEREGDKITRHQSKILLNSLYGKFGQRQVVSKILPYTQGLRYERLTGYSDTLHQNVEVNYLGTSIEIRYKSGESYYSCPVIAGAVTANARAYLWELISQAGLNYVYYVDTDSLIVNQAGFDRLSSRCDPERLGYLKLEGVEAHLKIYSLKDYEFGSEVKVKGVPKSSLKLAPNTWQYQQFRGAKTWIKDGMQSGVEVYTRLKERKSVYDKGVIQPDGSVLPLRLLWGEER